MTTPDDAPILTVAEAADVLRVSVRWLKRSSCPRIRAGGIVRYDRAIILAWFRAYADQRSAA